MLIVYKGKDKVLLTDYDGKRHAFYRNIPKEIPEKVYKAMVESGHVSAYDLTYVEPKKVVEQQSEVKPEPKIKPKKRKNKK